MNYIETRLVQLTKKGDRRAFEELVDLYKDKIDHLGYRMLHHSHEAEDIVQEAFLRVYLHLDRYDENQKFSTWIYRIATNLCIDRLRKRKASYSLDAEVQDNEGGMDWYSMLPSNEQSPEDQLLLTEKQLRIRKAIETLPEKYKAVVLLRYMEDMSLQEIGDVLNMPVTTVITRVHPGRDYLRYRCDNDFG